MDLQEMVGDISDVAAPACMEKLLVYLDQLQADDDDYMELLKSRVSGRTIYWDQPWYQKNNSLTRPLSLDDELEKFRTDSFTKKERHIVAKNWKKFRKEFDLPDTPINIARWKNRKNTRNPYAKEEQARHFLMAYLARGLERNLYQVNLFFTSHYGAPVKGPYSPLEEKIMQVCFYHSPTKAVVNASAILGREARGINKRLKFLFKEVQEKRRLKWSLPVATKFVKSLMKHSGMPLEALKNARFNQEVWVKVQEDMEQQYIYLQKFWYNFLHVQLFVKYDVKLKRVRKKILKILKNSSYEVWTDIRWKEMLQEFPDGFTHGFLYHAIHRLTLGFPEYRVVPLNELIDFCYNKTRKQLPSNRRRLRTLAFNDAGELEIVKYEEGMP